MRFVAGNPLRYRYTAAYGVWNLKSIPPPLPYGTGFERSDTDSALFSIGEDGTPHTQSSLSVLLRSAGFGGS